MDSEALRATLVGLGTALGIGLLVGLERERRKGDGPSRSPAGIRTFALAALLGGVSLALAVPGLFVAIAICVGLLVALAYARSRTADPGLTTEVALVVTFLLGALAMRQPALASGIAVLVTILLAARERLHRFARDMLSEREIHDGLLFAAAALVVLPLAPDRPVDPFGVLVPRKVWLLVVLVMAVGSAGYVAVRTLGARAGLPLSGFAGGFVSSAATIGSMGQRAKETPSLLRPAVSGAVLSTVATVIQLAIVLAAVDPRVLRGLMPSLALAGVVAVGYGAVFALRVTQAPSASKAEARRAFDLRAALVFAVVVSGVLVLAALAREQFGSGGVLAATALAGFADTHAAAISAASLASAGKIAPAEAVLPVLAAVSTNTVTKMVVAVTTGSRAFALQTIPGLVLVLAAAWLGTRLHL